MRVKVMIAPCVFPSAEPEYGYSKVLSFRRLPKEGDFLDLRVNGKNLRVFVDSDIWLSKIEKNPARLLTIRYYLATEETLVDFRADPTWKESRNPFLKWAEKRR